MNVPAGSKVRMEDPARNCVTERIKRFDELYLEVYQETEERRRGAPKAEIDLFQELLHPSLLAKFSNWIQLHRDTAQGGEGKDVTAVEALLCSTPSNPPLETLNQALRLSPHPPFRIHQQLLDEDFKIDEIEWALNQHSDYEGPVDDEEPERLLAQIYVQRAHCFQEKSAHESCILDMRRAIRCGHRNTFPTLLSLAMNYKALGYFHQANQLFHAALDRLRLSSAENDIKSKETMKIVKELKEIKSCPTPAPRNKRVRQTEELVGKLYGGESPCLVTGSAALELRYSVEMGRHVVANRNIPPGATLIVDHAYSWSLSPRNYAYFCQHCCSEAESCVPCQECSTVIFCNESCRKAAEPYHKYECGILKLLTSSEVLGEMAVICYRTVTRTDLSTLEAAKINEVDAAGLLGLDEKGQLNPSQFSSVLSQTTNSEHRSKADILKRRLVAIYLTLCLRFKGFFSQGEDLERRSFSKAEPFSPLELKVARLFVEISQSISCNGYGINSVVGSNARDLKITEIGGGTYPTVSLTNHSCCPNVYRYNVGRLCVVKSIAEIAKGEQIFDSYGPSFTTDTRVTRQSYLTTQYFFQCHCPACVVDWPLYAQLKTADKAEGGRKEGGKGRKSRQLVESEKKYERSKASLIAGDGLGQKSMESTFSHHLSILQNFCSPPHKLMVECQETLKLFWNLSLGTRTNAPSSLEQPTLSHQP